MGKKFGSEKNIYLSIFTTIYKSSQKFQNFGIESLCFGKISTYHQDLCGISANVNNILDSSLLILSQTVMQIQIGFGPIVWYIIYKFYIDAVDAFIS